MGKLDDKISSEKAKEIYSEQLQTDRTRKHVQCIIDEYTDSVQFMDKVKKYAGTEIDSRLFVSAKFWLTTIAASVASAFMALLVGKFFN